MWDINLILVFGWFGMELVISTSKFVACKRKKTTNVGLMAKEKMRMFGFLQIRSCLGDQFQTDTYNKSNFLKLQEEKLYTRMT